MVTGKDDTRIEWARRAVRNFYDQDYPFKQMVIINHHPHQDVLVDKKKYSNVREFKVIKHERVTLGDLRNIALELVAHDALWTTWDDDDWRAPTYLTWLYEALVASKEASCVTFTTRYEYNSNNDFVWKMRRKTGFPLVLAPFDRRVRYLSKDSMEDTELLDKFQSVGKNVKIIDNEFDPQMYVRVVHGNNTSLYVNKQKNIVKQGHGQSSNYFEMPSTDDERAFVLRTMQTYTM